MENKKKKNQNNNNKNNNTYNDYLKELDNLIQTSKEISKINKLNDNEDNKNCIENKLINLKNIDLKSLQYVKIKDKNLEISRELILEDLKELNINNNFIVSNILYGINDFLNENNLSFLLYKIPKENIKIYFNNKNLYTDKLHYFHCIFHSKELRTEIKIILEPILTQIILKLITEKTKSIETIIKKKKDKLSIKDKENITSFILELLNSKLKEILIKKYNYEENDLNNLKIFKLLQYGDIEDIDTDYYDLYETKITENNFNNKNTINNFYSNLFIKTIYYSEENTEKKLDEVKNIIINSEIAGTYKKFYLKINKNNIKKLKKILNI